MSFKKWLSKNDKATKSKVKSADSALQQPVSSGSVLESSFEPNSSQSGASTGEKLLNAVGLGDTNAKVSSTPDAQAPLLAHNGHHGQIQKVSGAPLEGASGLAFDPSDPEDLEAEYDLFPLVRPQVTELMPYGDGSNKVFGYENFGNTCYCNSVLQVLYNLSELRTNVLEKPVTNSAYPRKRKSEMPGLKPRIFDDTSFLPHNCANDHSKKSTSGSSNGSHSSPKEPGPRKNSAPQSRDREVLRSAMSSRSVRSQSSATVHGTVMPSDAITEKLHEGYTRIVVGRVTSKHSGRCTQEGSSNAPATVAEESAQSSFSDLSTASTTRPEDASSEERKKAALIRGPVINVDHSLSTSQGEKTGLFTALKDVYESIAENKHLSGVVAPTQFVETLKRENVLFRSMMHQDAHEFLNFLLNEMSDYLESDAQATGQKPSNFVEQLFKGTMTNRTRCLTCDNVTHRDEPFLDFAIEVQGDGETDIETTLSDYHQREMLNGANKFYCDECCGLQEAERIVGIKQLPFYFGLHMKRFKYSEKQNCNIKLFNKIHYPLNLKVCSTFDSSVCKWYELIGLVVHMGGGPHHGHYVSLCKTEKFGWLLYDDETVETVNESTVLKFVGNSDDLTTAYLLFYREVPLGNEDTSGNEARHDYSESVDQLIKLDDKIRTKLEINRVDQAGVLDEIPDKRSIEHNMSGKFSNKNSKRRSRLFSFKKSARD
ncbi:LADA_0H08900g1_1 [Lachancea dasiensis]|uniref:Ubiquitin carboxyl-terminal hydrolase n=1 Tax=Lachancea dasiensis TaxID=1072105 RepID=A0A1G4K2Q2_9SACH|nr:LADA_0H08900g1_1 [Lachancea dasiensis]